MTVGGALIVYAAVVGFGGPAAFRRAAWLLRAPRLGAAAVVAAAWSVPVALVLAGMTLFLPASGLTVDLVHLVGACLGRLRAAYGTPAGAGIITAGQVLTAGMLARGAWAVARVMGRRRVEHRRHRLLVQWAGTDVPEVPAIVLEQAEAAAFAVAGRQRTVVVTRGILDLLSAPELAAVLAHEHAHLAARHHRWLTAATLVAQALPMVPLLRDAPALVGGLLEMEADELAAAHHEPQVIARALVAVATSAAAVTTGRRATVTAGGAGRGPARSSGGGPPRAARSAGGSEALARVQRLLHPPARLPAVRRAIARTAIVGFTVAPLLLAAAPIVVALA